MAAVLAKNAPQLRAATMESLEVRHSVLSAQKVLINGKQEVKCKLMSGAKEAEAQRKIGETNFTAALRPSKPSKRSTNLGLEADPTALTSCSYVA